MKHVKNCKYCGKEFEKPSSCNIYEWIDRQYCSISCGAKGRGNQWLNKYKFKKGSKIGEKTRYKKGNVPWSKVNPHHFTEEQINVFKKNAEEYRRNETEEQRKTRIEHLIKNRTESLRKGLWQPSRRYGKENHLWLDDKATYNSKHRWIQEHWKKTGICQFCGNSPTPTGKRKWGTEWANKTGLYDRNNKNDWLELCKRCHLKFDKQQPKL